jgi:lipoprotein-anchoring transpeptidase ErfK/SrfK
MAEHTWTTPPRRRLAALLFAALGGCGIGHSEDDGDATIYGDDRGPTAEVIEAARRDVEWREVEPLDTAGTSATTDTLAFPETFKDITPTAVNDSAMRLPLMGDIAGPSVLRLQVLLDRAYFSPGVMDGSWGANTAKALYWLQRREGLRATGELDSVTFARLATLAGSPKELVVRRRLSADDVAGPFVKMPENDWWAQAELSCSCYESLTEKLGEMFHATPRLIAKLNPGVALDALKEGDALWVPNVRDTTAMPATVERLVVSDRGKYLHAVDAQGRIVYHFPATLGASYEPSPSGDFRIVRVKENPAWHLQPELLAKVPDDKPAVVVPAGPNNAVGLVWMALSAPHYGIHGTKAPETIGYASSAGCVRLTNWDAVFLARRVRPNVPVQFRDSRGGTKTVAVK